jgi:biotin carboxyl carrier protein
VIIEAMKMEMPIVSDDAGTVKAVNCKTGDTVEADAVLVELE